MIRRPPTLIQMTDMDVQQVRDALSRQKESLATQPGATATPLQTAATAPAPAPAPYHHPEEQKKKREGMTRDERLGLR
ncbi:hypothetical protein C8Q80DRAFT_1181411 [Daedaleopsis nitida]|nr:hypothetical protein C8Q80DRAFT_1181411 [Daedaleopsis nitida]